MTGIPEPQPTLGHTQILTNYLRDLADMEPFEMRASYLRAAADELQQVVALRAELDDMTKDRDAWKRWAELNTPKTDHDNPRYLEGTQVPPAPVSALPDAEVPPSPWGEAVGPSPSLLQNSVYRERQQLVPEEGSGNG